LRGQSESKLKVKNEILKHFKTDRLKMQDGKGAITSTRKHAIKLKTSHAKLAQLLQPSLAFCFSLQPMTEHWTVRRHWLQAKTKC